MSGDQGSVRYLGRIQEVRPITLPLSVLGSVEYPVFGIAEARSTFRVLCAAYVIFGTLLSEEGRVGLFHFTFASLIVKVVAHTTISSLPVFRKSVFCEY